MSRTRHPRGPVVGVFDSGFGGLTVLRALLPRIAGAHYLYLGDTARLPYGAKSQATIARYAVSSGAFLLSQGIDLLVVACNTASALALDELSAALPVPVLGVIEPGARAAAAVAQDASRSPDIHSADVLVLATAATVQSAAYTRTCAALGLAAHEKACPLLVPLVEEGWIDQPVTLDVLRIYLAEALAEAPDATTLLLGCTHYPLLRPAIERTLRELGHPMHIVDSADATAAAAAQIVIPGEAAGEAEATATCEFYATDSIEKFQILGSRFLGRPLREVNLIDLGG